MWVTLLSDAALRRQCDRPILGIGEEAHATAEQDRDEVQSQLLDDAGVEVVPDDRGTTGDADVPLAGCLPRQAQGSVRAIGDKRVARPAGLDDRLGWAVGDDQRPTLATYDRRLTEAAVARVIPVASL
jgi:hypothetical protein